MFDPRRFDGGLRFVDAGFDLEVVGLGLVRVSWMERRIGEGCGRVRQGCERARRRWEMSMGFGSGGWVVKCG